MNEATLKSLWQSANEQISINQAITRKNAADIAQLKIKALLDGMRPVKLFTLIVGILWVLVGATLLSNIYWYDFAGANKFFLFAATVQILLTAAAIVIYLYQLVIISQVDVSAAVLNTQRKLMSLRVSSLWVVRILFLQLPCWTIFYWNYTMLQDWSVWQWMLQLLVTAVFTVAAGWIFLHVKFENRDKRWFGWLFSGKEWAPLIASIDLLEEVKAYREE